MFRLNRYSKDFPDPNLADGDGLLALGGLVQSKLLKTAYRKGIFPWYGENEPVLWWSPDPRCVLKPEAIHISSSLKKVLRKGRFRVTFNEAFERVIRLCAEPRAGVADTWISGEMIKAYTELYNLGHILSVECWDQHELVMWDQHELEVQSLSRQLRSQSSNLMNYQVPHRF